MAHAFFRVLEPSGQSVWVNAGSLAYVRGQKDGTTDLYFQFTVREQVFILKVNEPADDVIAKLSEAEGAPEDAPRPRRPEKIGTAARSNCYLVRR